MKSPIPGPCALIVAAILMLATMIPTPFAASDDPAGAERAREIGLKASETLQKKLGGALMKALKDGGPAAAVSVCADTAQVLTARIADELGVPGLELKRTSLHLRNPTNRPDSLETRVLQDYTAALSESETAEPRLDRLDDRYRFFTPIVTREFCLQCHGSREDISKEVAAILAERYPEDGATGHRKGDLRGIVSVVIPVVPITEENPKK